MAAVRQDLEMPQQKHGEQATGTQLDELGALGIDGSINAAQAAKAPRSFELPTETFVRKTGMRDRGPPGFEYNSTEHLSISAVKPGASGSAVFLAPGASRSSPTLPGVHVRAYAASPTRDDQVEDAHRAAQARADQARKAATKSRRDRHILLATTIANSPGNSKKSGASVWKSPHGLSTVLIRAPRSRALEEQAWREALKAKARAIAVSPREGKNNVDAAKRRKRGPPRKAFRRVASTLETRTMFQGVLVPRDAFTTPFAGGNKLDALPGGLESLIFPQRYWNWPKQDALVLTLALDVKSSPIRHAVAFRSKQPRIVGYDAQRETRDWDGPGAYERDEALGDDGNGGGSNVYTGNRGGGGDDKTGGKVLVSKGVRPKGIHVRDPKRLSPVFREGASEFMPPRQTNVRGFALVPVSGQEAVTGDEEGRDEEGGTAGENKGTTSRKRGGAANGRRKKPQRLWMFQPPGKEYQPAAATEGWGGPGAYATESDTVVRVREPGRLSPVFREGSGRRGPTRWERDVSAFPACPGGRTDAEEKRQLSTPDERGRDSPGTPDILAKWSVSCPEFRPPEPRTVAHDVRQSPVRFGACFLSVTDRFDSIGPYAFTTPETPLAMGPGAGERSRGDRGGVGGPVEKYDHVNARQQPPPSNTWLGTSILPGLPYNPALGVESTTAGAKNANTHHGASTSCSSQSPHQHQGRDEFGGDGGGAAATGVLEGSVGGDSTTVGSGESTAFAGTGGGTGGTGGAVGLLPMATIGNNKTTTSGAFRRGLLAAEAVAKDAAATAAAGLAQNWAGSRLTKSCVGGDDRSKRERGRNKAARGDCSAVHTLGGLVSTSTQVPGAAAGAVTLSRGGDGDSQGEGLGKDPEKLEATCVGAGECPRQDLAALKTAVEMPTAVAAARTDGARVAAAFHRRRNHKKYILKTLSSSRDFHICVSAKGGVTKGTSGTTTTATTATPATTATTVGVITEDALAAVEALTPVMAEQSGGLIRTVGRAKRGPCMLTLASSQTERRVKNHSTTKSGNGKKRMWKAEANGGLLGPGETKVLVC